MAEGQPAASNNTPPPPSPLGRWRAGWNKYCRFHERFLKPIEGILAIAAIIFAGIQFRHSKSIIDTSKHLNAITADLADKATNKYIGNFPNNIGGIDAVMDNTCHKLNIMVDFAAYGGYSATNRPNFDDYSETLIRAVSSTWDDKNNQNKCIGINKVPGESNVQVKLLLFSPAQRRLALQSQIGDDFLDEKKYPDARATFKRFFKKNFYLIGQESPDTYLQKVLSGGKVGYDDFVAKLEQANSNEERIFRQRGIEIKFSNEPYLIYLWMHDDKEAAFSFYMHRATRDNSVETTFSTRDKDLLRTFNNIFEDEWNRACPYDCYYDPGACSQAAKQVCSK